MTSDTSPAGSALLNSTTLSLYDPHHWDHSYDDVPKYFNNGDSYVVKAKKTDICFARKNYQGWTKVKLDVPANNDQFQPSIDYSDTPNELLIGYYDRSDDPLNSSYRARWVKTYSWGAKKGEGLFSDSFFTSPNGGFIGDYTDTWFWPYQDGSGSRYHFVFSAEYPYGSGFDVFAGAVN